MIPTADACSAPVETFKNSVEQGHGFSVSGSTYTVLMTSFGQLFCQNFPERNFKPFDLKLCTCALLVVINAQSVYERVERSMKCIIIAQSLGAFSHKIEPSDRSLITVLYTFFLHA